MHRFVRVGSRVWATLAFALLLSFQASAAADNCTAQQRADLIRQLKEEPTTWRQGVNVTCDLTLRATDVIKKVIRFSGASASNLTLNCNGAQIGPSRGSGDFPINYNIVMVQVMSEQRGDGGWSRPSGVTIRDCDVRGTVTIRGPTLDDKQANYKELMRSAAPSNILLERMRITVAPEQPAPGGYTTERIGLYVFPGATHVTLKDSTIAGSTRLNVYLDAETANNTFRNVQFRATTANREQIAIDGSSNNLFVNNYFGALSNGGVYLYRNCGEAGKIRHATPSHNRFINNVFYYDNYDGSNPAIWIGSRNGKKYNHYCHLENGYPWGSSASNLDHATNNVVMQNRVVKRGMSVFEIGSSTDANNLIRYNESVSTWPPRAAGCYSAFTSTPDLVRSGSTVNLVVGWTCMRATCSDGAFIPSSASSCSAPPLITFPTLAW